MKMKIKELREINNIPQKALANILGISSNTLSQYENEKRNPSFEIVAKLSKFFNVSTDYIYGLCTYTICNECGLAYCPNYDLDIETHKEIHLNWVKAKQKYGFNYSLGECERIKGEKRNIVKNLYLPLEERYEAQIEVYKCLFFRCLEANNYDDDFIDFEDYVAMLLMQPSQKTHLGKELYEKLTEEFGTKAGIPDGYTYYYPNKGNDKIEDTLQYSTTRNLSSAEHEHIKKYRFISTHSPDGASVVDTVLDREYTIAGKLKEQDGRIKVLEAQPTESIEIYPLLNSPGRITDYYRSASAGDGIFILGGESTAKIALSEADWNDKADYAISISGTSMEPDYNDGDTVLVSQRVQIQHGDVGIFVVDGKAYIKEYGEKELISRNPQAENIKISEYSNIVCMGKVVGKIKGEYQIIND